MTKAFTIAAVGVLRLFRDRSNIFFVFVLPLALVFLIGSVFGGGFTPTIGVSAPDGELAREVVSRLEETDGIAVRSYTARDELVRAVERGDVQAGVILPVDFDEALEGDGTVAVEFLARPDAAGPQLRTAVAAAIAEESALVRAARFGARRGLTEAFDVARRLQGEVSGVEVVTRAVGEALFPSSLGRFDLGASQQLVLFMFLTGLAGASALIETRQLGVIRRMMSTPTGVGTILLGEVLGRYGVVLVQGVYIVAFSLFAFGVDWGDPLGAVAILVVFGAVSAAFAVLMGATFRNAQQAGGLGVILGLGVAALGGSMVPLEIFSPTMRRVAHLTPHAWAYDAFAELVRRDGSLSDILGELGVLAAYALVAGTLAVWRLRVVTTRE